MKLYRLYTEDKNESELRRILDSGLTGYTIIKAQGVWQRVAENSLIIEYIGKPEEQYRVETAAMMINELNDQQAVFMTFMTVSDIESVLIERRLSIP